MRGVVTCSRFMVAFAIVIIIHATITGNNIRYQEVKHSLDSAMDYAFDRLGDVYADVDFTSYGDEKRHEILTDLMKEFCNVLYKEITSDGNIEVALIYADMDKGLFQIGVTEEYAHPFGGRTGKCYYEKTYSFN